jgi:hypothetical protein
LERILLLEVPVIVKLAECDMPCSESSASHPARSSSLRSHSKIRGADDQQQVHRPWTSRQGRRELRLRIMDIGTLKDKIAPWATNDPPPRVHPIFVAECVCESWL